ncbi:uncharacterized protein LOC128162973 [Crassostrea angulata]|uniref:uncharacterized protein LOC128162973 n=1 Tax=Magallana angulata TaxID=2784310 RepID=UPI0022B1EA78|nr:uncharacterized protein LOC128162973 [Crassostrea angulata]
MNFRTFIKKATTVVKQIALVTCIFTFNQGLVRSEYIVNVASRSTWVNPGDNNLAYCNIPGQGALDIIQNLKVKWFHNGQALTSLCEFLSSDLTKRYSCKVLGIQQNNISLELTVLNVQKADAGNLTCEVYEKIKVGDQWVRDEVVAIKSVPIHVREPCRVMQGRIVDMDDNMGTQFVADATEFRGNSQINVMCTAEVEGLPYSKMQRTFRVEVIQRDPKFRCTNTSAIVNNTQHNITCEVYDVEGISCNKILWKRGDTGEDYEPGSYNNIIVTCREVTDSKIETTLEILQVTAEYFRTSLSVIYNDPLFQTKEYLLIIPEASKISWSF